MISTAESALPALEWHGLVAVKRGLQVSQVGSPACGPSRVEGLALRLGDDLPEEVSKEDIQHMLLRLLSLGFRA